MLTGVYAFGHVSGGHFNPAVTIGLAVAKRFEWKGVAPYIGIQIVAASIVLTAIFLYIILGATDDRAPKGFAPIAIGLGLTLIHLVSIPVTNTSVNPARSIGVAWFAGGPAIAQLWLFIVAPIIGAAIAGISYAKFTGENPPIDVGIANNP